ncbi:hypothetical protein MF672_005615 [Actinomadura sp. ATCC 31491]|uniref:Uncharacterized protein n=1 Tax=Actinomadura luzonensis TaxID=2805427 RepID=A0ABT0FLR3_9ACTN|nr:hypothetical protein [Actinomadura luzonensis]MCK2213275.1 hypothetical protein [Actinomadura luzonensis]
MPAHLVSLLLPGVLGLVLGEAFLRHQIEALQRALGSMTFIVVEALGALLIDFPLAFLSSLLYLALTPGTGPAREGMLAGARFLTTFLLLVALMAVLRRFTGRFDVAGLHAAVRTSIIAARDGLSWRFPLMMGLFLVADYLLCMLAGLLAYQTLT